MREVYFIYNNKIRKGTITDKKSDGIIAVSGNEILWIPAGEPKFRDEAEALEYLSGYYLTPQEKE